MSAPDPAAIEAGSRAIYEVSLGKMGPESAPDWDDLEPSMRDWYRDDAKAAYASMEPHIRKTVAEEIARRIETDARYADGGYADGASSAATIAREHGKART